jgi:hypothetical protein
MTQIERWALSVVSGANGQTVTSNEMQRLGAARGYSRHQVKRAKARLIARGLIEPVKLAWSGLGVWGWQLIVQIGESE